MTRRLAYLCLQATTEGQASHAHVHEIIAGLREEGWEVDLYEPSYAGGAAPGAMGRLLEFRRVQKRLASRLREYDALYVRSHALALPASRAGRRAGIPVIQECNGPYEDLFLAWPAVRPLAWWLIRAMREQYHDADALITVTPQLAEWLEAEARRVDVAVVPNGANTDLFRPDATTDVSLPDRYAVFFGALAPWQGLGTCLDATRNASWPEGVSLVVAGDGALRTEVEAAAAERPEHVRYLGRLGYRDVPGVVCGALASLVPMHLPERDDRGLSPLKLFESMACGVPVIASDLPGLSETVRQSGGGLTAAPGDPAALASAVATLASDPDRAAEMGARGRAFVVEHASWRARAQATSFIIVRAIERKATR